MRPHNFTQKESERERSSEGARVEGEKIWIRMNFILFLWRQQTLYFFLLFHKETPKNVV